MTTARYKIEISYDGADYRGWQIQPGGVTIQSELESAIYRITGCRSRVHGSGRTDRGVHARKQVAHFDLPEQCARGIKNQSLLRGLNALLPDDIRVRRILNVPSSFHARKSVIMKEYRYFITDTYIPSPFVRRYRLHLPRKLNDEAMRKAASYLVGRHDFAAYTANPNREVGSTVCLLSELKVTRRGSEIVITARGPGFMYKMVRSIVGLLVRVGEGCAAPSDARRLLVARTRTAEVPTAPAKGLFLWNVVY